MSIQNVLVLGSTGSIGVSTLDVIGRHPDRYRPYALTANSNVEVLLQQCLEFKPQYAVMSCEQSAQRLKQLLASAGSLVEVLSGESGLIAVSEKPEIDTVMAAIVGAAGLAPTLAAAKLGKRILLANKEALVMAGSLFMDAVTESGAILLPIDSEHNAIFQCLPHDYRAGYPGVRKLLLTGSGGPFRETPIEQLDSMTPDQACAHPNWSMGRKISVDSATMMNKGLEFIEARWLFDVAPEMIEVVLHPQSIIHSMVEYDDGSVLAQMGQPDMRTPIAHALAWPDRIDSGVQRLDFSTLCSLSFSSPDFDRFPLLKLAMDAASRNDTSAVIINAANEVAVAAFLAEEIPFTAIAQVVAETLNASNPCEPSSLELVKRADSEAREIAQRLVTEPRYAVSQ